MEKANLKIFGELLKIELPKELDHNVANSIRREIDEKIYAGKIKDVEFDFTETNFMDSSGIGMIVGRYKLIKPIGGKIILTGVKGNVERIINISGIHKLIK